MLKEKFINGCTSIRSSKPSISTFDNCLYLPWNENGNWGIFSSTDGKHIKYSRILRNCNERRRIPQKSSYFQNDTISTKSVFEKSPLLKGTYIYLGFITHHFGHFLIESLSRVWYQINNTPNIKGVVFHCKQGLEFVSENKAYVSLLTSFIEKDKIFIFDTPKRIENIIVPEPGIVINSHLYQHHNSALEKIGENILKHEYQNANKNLTPLYISKSQLKGGFQRVKNEIILEKILEKEGFDIVHPEKFSIKAQLKLFNERKYIASSIGSALHSFMFLKGNKRMTVYSLSRQINSTYLLIDAAKNNKIKHILKRQLRLKDVNQAMFKRSFLFDDPEMVSRIILENMFTNEK